MGRAWRSRWAAIGAAVAVTLGAGGLLSVSAESGAASFVAISPERILDTRSGDAIGATDLGGGGAPYELQVTGGVIPSSATAVALNITVVDGRANDFGGFVTVYPCGPRPDVSNLNFVTGQTVPNSVVAPLSADGAVCLYVYGLADLLVDISGYYDTTSTIAGPAGPAGPAGASGFVLGEDDVVSRIPDAIEPSIAIGADGNPIIAYVEDARDQLMLAVCGDVTCASVATTVLVDTADQVRSPSVSITDAGNPVVAYRDVTGTASKVKLVYCNDPECAVVQPLQGFATTGVVGRPVLLSHLADAGTVVAFHDGANVYVGVCARVMGPCNDVSATGYSWAGRTVTGVDMVLGSDGIPTIVISSVNGARTAIEATVARCALFNCATVTVYPVSLSISGLTNATTSSPAATVGADGYLQIAFGRIDDASAKKMTVLDCSDLQCTAASASPVHWATLWSQTPDVTMTVDGDPLLTYRGQNDGGTTSPSMLNVVRCRVDCTDRVVAQIVDDPLVHAGLDPVVTLTSTGMPLVVYSTWDELVIRSCAQMHCNPHIRPGG